MIVMAQIASNLFMKGNAQLSVQRALDKPWTFISWRSALHSQDPGCFVFCFSFCFFINILTTKPPAKGFVLFFSCPNQGGVCSQVQTKGSRKLILG